MCLFLGLKLFALNKLQIILIGFCNRVGSIYSTHDCMCKFWWRGCCSKYESGMISGSFFFLTSS